MLKEFESMWNTYLEYINDAKHHLSLTTDNVR